MKTYYHSVSRMNRALALVCAVACLSGMVFTVFAQIPPDNLGRIVEIATPAGILPQPHLLIGWDSTGYVRQANSTDSFKVFANFPNQTALNGINSLNSNDRFGAPDGNDSYEIRYGDSSYYWNNSTLAPGKLPFAVYRVGRRSSASQDTSVVTRLCIRRASTGFDFFSDLALPLDSTYWEMATQSAIPFSSGSAVIRRFRTGKPSVPYTQTTWDALTDSITPSAGTVLRLVAQSADSIAPVVAIADSVEFPNAADTLVVPFYSFEAPSYALASFPANMTMDAFGIIRWNYSASQSGHRYTVVVQAENFIGVSYQTFTAIAGYSGAYLHALVRVRNNDLDFWTANDGTIAYNAPQTVAGLHFNTPHADLIYAGGFYIGTRKAGQSAPDTITVSDVEWGTEFQPGRILNSGDLGGLIPEDPEDSTLGVYLLPDHAGEWPAEAPHDALGSPLKLSLRDSWTVFNDVVYEPGPFEEAPVLGLEVQRQTFMFRASPWNNSVLVRMRIINKSNRTYDSTYVGLWQDPDVGYNSSSNLAAVDSSLSLIYCYSASGDIPVASGTLLLQGPLDQGSLSDTAVTLDIGPQGFIVRPIPQRQTRMSSAAFGYGHGLSEHGDVTRYYYLQGLDNVGNPKPGGPFEMFSSVPGDQVTMLSAGPFTFAAGDTQVVWYAYVGAIGANDPGAVDTLKYYAALMRQAFPENMNDIVVGVSDHPIATIPDFRLYSNYPNPFNPSTTIRYVLPKPSRVSLKVYNILGQEVRTLVDTRQGIGEHAVAWDGKNKLGAVVSSGVYLYRLEVDGKVKVKKMMLLK